MSGLGNFVYSLLVLAHVSEKSNEALFFFFRFIEALAPGIWKATYLAIILERSIATVYAKSYEHKAKIWLGFGLLIFGVGLFLNPIIV